MEEKQAWDAYQSVVRPMVTQFITEQKKSYYGAVGRTEISQLWFFMNIPTAYLRNQLSWFTLYEDRGVSNPPLTRKRNL